MKTKKVGNFPVNSRVKITYPEIGKPKIKFEYPSKKSQLKDIHNSGPITILALILTLITMLLFYILIYSLIPINYPTCIINTIGDSYTILNISSTLSPGNLTIVYNASSILAACGKKGGGWMITWEKSFVTLGGEWRARAIKGSSEYFIEIYMVGMLFIIYLGGFYIYSRFLSKVVKKTSLGKKSFPLLNKFISDKHYAAEFTKCPNNLQIELPLFNNIYLDYEATKEFADYLQEVEIKEHDIKYYKGKRFFGLLKRKHKQGIPNVYLWKAIFKFKQLPKKGGLKIKFT